MDGFSGIGIAYYGIQRGGDGGDIVADIIHESESIKMVNLAAQLVKSESRHVELGGIH